ncbi:hypothetical protein H0X10_01020 [Candidatus Saccharibacteria bacterium]|nr:hypothetical protein [Candidatus Saccharibacteria bacterium]
MDNQDIKEPVYGGEDAQLLGYVGHDSAGWYAATLFGVPFSRKDSEAEARDKVENQGFMALTSPWEYFNPDDEQWHKCAIVDAKPTHLTLAPWTGSFPDHSKKFEIDNPNSTQIRIQQTY